MKKLLMLAFEKMFYRRLLPIACSLALLPVYVSNPVAANDSGPTSSASKDSLSPDDPAEELQVVLRSRVATETGSGNFHTSQQRESWKPSETAIVVCDMWDLHHCHNAVIRVGQLATPMEKVLNRAREQGATIIHAPSSCMDFYEDHPARNRATSTQPAKSIPQDIDSWCTSIPAEEQGIYPIDQSDGGEDDDPVDHAEWAKELTGRGLNPKAPWSRQTEALSIDADRDYISDSGSEIWSILESRKVKNVVLVGVHTNMCVLGRPFGLRQMAKNGKNVVLMRDMTDTMYNPAAKPFVSHFSGTDLIIEHIEKYVCPTIASDQFIGGTPFVFPKDNRKHIAIVIAEDEYQTDQSLQKFAAKHLQKDYRVSFVFGNKLERNDIPGLEIINDADVLLLSIRRRVLPPQQLDLIRKFEAAGKPMIGIRTSSHAFCLRNKPPPEGLVDWPEFDAEVWGGSYSGHTTSGINYRLVQSIDTEGHPIRKGIDESKLTGHHSLYKTEPLAGSTTCIFRGASPLDDTHHAAAWLNRRANGGLSFYTSLGHVDDFKQDDFQQLLRNAVDVLVTEIKTK